MKKILFLLLMMCPVLAYSQGLVNFKLQPNASFKTSTGEDFVVVPFEGKTAHEIYQMLRTNVGTYINKASSTLSEVEDASITVFAHSDNLYTMKLLGIPHYWQGNYKLEFRIKDGRVRVSAPYIVNEIYAKDVKSNVRSGNFDYYVNKWFKDGKAKEKELANVNRVENIVNRGINTILGLQGETVKIDEDW